MKTLLQILAFSLMVIYGYTWFSNSIPQMQSQPPSEEEISLEGMTLEGYAALGEKIYEGKGTCPLCHNAVGHRAPLLIETSDDGQPVAVRSTDRLQDLRYKGDAESAEEYLRESMIKPSAFVVVGFGKTGSGDTISPMPDVSAGSMNLSEVEINAVIAYLQQAAGIDITVSLPIGEIDVDEEDETEDPGPVKDFSQLVEKYECKVCHVVPNVDMEGEEPDMGPSLVNMAEQYKGKLPAGYSLEDYIRTSILKPNEHIAMGFESDIMPDDLSERMRVSELEMAVQTIIGAGKGN